VIGKVITAGRIRLTHAAPDGVLPADEPHRLYSAVQRCIDLAFGSVLLLLSLPVIALACVAIAVSTRRSPLLVQRRVGHLGDEFPMLKLRTMKKEGEPRPFGAKPQNDDRVTAVGRVLRRTSVDELPQLLNVLAGQMTLVGPRPGLPIEVAGYKHAWRRRLSVKPGLTGLWQVSGRSSLPVDRWMALDRVYLRRRSTGFDLLILLRSVAAVLSMRGAW
jgi:lipopolysaccharide/colanic/teichoic acid biosynthesis glycosyltransferase